MAMIKRRKFRPSDEMSPAKKRAMIGPKLSFAAAEAYKVLRTNLMFSMPDENKCRIVVFRSETLLFQMICLLF